MKYSQRAGRLLSTSALVSAAFAAAVPALAQDEDGDTIFVTGSRIQRADLSAPSPVTTVDALDLSLSNTVNSEQFLNSLPQVIPSFDGSSNNPGDGTATVDLRGLGTQRTLVLVDGTRYVSSSLDGVVDLNSIPAALVEQVDIVTGGASAVYGSDAMAGVVNFILKDDFEGLETNYSYEITEEGDGGIHDMSIVAGGNFDDGRGNVTLFIGYTARDEVFQGDRDFSTLTNVDNGDGFGEGGSSGVPGTRLFDTFNWTERGFESPTIGALDSETGNFASNCDTIGLSTVDPDGSLSFTDNDDDGEFGAGDTAATGASGDEYCGGGATFDENGDPVIWVNAGLDGTTAYNYAPINYLQLPQERYNISTFARYGLTDTIEAYVRGVYSSSTVSAELAPTPLFDTFTINTSTLTDDQADLIQSSGNVDANGDYEVFIGRRMVEVGPRNSTTDFQSFQIAGGLTGEYGNDWVWDVYSHFTRTSNTEVQTGNVSRSAFQDALDSGDCQILGADAFSQECVDLVSRTAAALTEIEQKNVIATTSGSIDGFSLPWAESGLGVAFGVEYREEDGWFRPDSVLGPDVAGFNQALPTSGGFTTTEVFGEGRLALVEGASFAEELYLEGAYRFTDHSIVGDFSSYAYGGSWVPISDLRFRAQYQRAVRAPSLEELFAPVTNNFPGATDPCADPEALEELYDRAVIRANCIADGVAESSFGNDGLQPNAQIENLSGGNEDLTEETSDTITVGFVAQPSQIEGLTLQVDYYKIEIEDVIGNLSLNRVFELCYGEGDAQACAAVDRRADGVINTVSTQVENLAFLSSEGIDITADYSFDIAAFGGSTVNINYNGGISLTDEFQEDSGAPIVDCSGTFGTDDGRCDEPDPEYKHTTRFDLITGDLLTSLRWRYIGETEADVNADTLFAGEIDAYNYLDLTFNKTMSDSLALSLGISNLTNEDPPELGDCCSEQANTWPATYETLGRQIFFGVNAKF